jgi:hypothetical protein
MVDTALLDTLERLTPGEQKALLAVAEYIVGSRNVSGAGALADAIIAEIPGNAPQFDTPDQDLSPARRAARRFMRENPELMRLLAQ